MTDIVTRLHLRDEYEVMLDHLNQPYGLAKSLEHEAAAEIERLRAERDEAVAALALYRAENGCTRGQRTTQWCGEATKLRERLLQVNAGLLRALQYENKCDQTGKPCNASRRCACSLEAETWCEGDGT